MKKLAGIVSIFLYLILVPVAEARSGCCSHHGGVSGCGCADGSPLSATCLPYYPECENPSQGTVNQPAPVYTPPPVVYTPAPTPKYTYKPTPKLTVKPNIKPSPKPSKSSKTATVSAKTKVIQKPKPTSTSKSKFQMKNFWKNLFSFF